MLTLDALSRVCSAFNTEFRHILRVLDRLRFQPAHQQLCLESSRHLAMYISLPYAFHPLDYPGISEMARSS